MDEESVRAFGELISIRDRVARREITTVEADREAEAKSLPPFVQYITETANILAEKDWWPLTLGTIWITRREVSATAARWAAFKVWKCLLWPDDYEETRFVRLHDAEPALWRALEAGKVRSTGIEKESRERIDIPAVQWSELEWLHDDMRQIVRNRSSNKEFSFLKVSRTDIQLIWPSVDQSSLSTTVDPTSSKFTPSKTLNRSKGGAPMAEHWHAMWAEICTIIHEESLPPKRLDLVKRMQQWFEDNDLDAPSNQTLNPIIQKVYDAWSNKGF